MNAEASPFRGAVFLSYASQDAEAVARIAEALRAAGVEVWFDADGGLEHGDAWDAKIRRQIRECVLFVPIISANTQAREEGYFRIEWDLAAERARGIAAGIAFILPVVIDGTDESSALVPDRFRAVQWMRLPDGVVTPEVRTRLLKLWSHRTGALKHEAARASETGHGRSGLPSGRGLAAIVFTDVVGYSARMQRDEAGTLTLVRADFSLMRGRCAEHGGEVLNTMGDGMLLCFPSAVQAVTCALQLQAEFGARRAALPPEQALEHRMGVHIGDVFRQEDGGVAGDGVNLAARLEGKAPVGGVCISQMVYDTVKGKVPMQAVFIGPETFKNIAEPIPVWHIAAKGAVTPTRPPLSAAKRARRWRWPAAATVVVALAVVGGWIWSQRAPAPPIVEPGRAPKVNFKSVAVLPFANQSTEKENEYFSDGIADELLTVLGKIPGLQVAARMSVWAFKGKNLTGREVGEKLGMAHIVDGSVQKIGNRVKITARLCRAATNEELWSKSFGPMELTDVFATQSEIAQAVVAELRGRLTGESAATTQAAQAEIRAQVRAAEKGGTKNVAAHELYLQGNTFTLQLTPENSAQAVTHFRQAVELDSGFALGWAALANILAQQGTYGLVNRPAAELFGEVRSAAERALVLEPDLAEGHMARTQLRLMYEFDWKGARASARRALELAPSNAAILSASAYVEVAFGQMDRALDLARQAMVLDPLNFDARVLVIMICFDMGDFKAGEAEARRSLALNPKAAYMYNLLGMALLMQGQVEEGAAMIEREPIPAIRTSGLAYARWKQGRIAEAEAALKEMLAQPDLNAYWFAEIYASRGDRDQAFAWLERCWTNRDSGISHAPSDIFLKPLHADPRWPVFMRKVGLAEDQLK